MKTATDGPLIVFGDRNPQGSGSGAGGSMNPDKAPSVFYGGLSIMDHRGGYNRYRAGVIGWYGAGNVPVIDQIPAAISASNISTAQSSTAGAALTLSTSTNLGVTTLGTATTFWSSGTLVPATARVIDSVPALISFGLASVSTNNTTVSMYDPTTMVARNVRITMSGDDHARFFTVAGYDIYGNSMTEKITGTTGASSAGAAGSISSGKKAFKFVNSITPSAAMTSTSVQAGTGDVYGMPFRFDNSVYVSAFWGSSIMTSVLQGSSTGFVVADTTTASSTTGDVRGTWSSSSASDGTNRLVAFVRVSPANTISTGLFGNSQA